MNTKTIATVGMIAATLLASTANAVEPRWPNWYVGLHAGAVNYEDSDFDSTVPAESGEVNSNTGFIGGISLGYVPATTRAFFNQTRWELEYTYRQTDNDTIDGAALDGEVQVDSYMANLYYDFYNTSRWTPYVGAGFGYAQFDVDAGTNGAGDPVTDEDGGVAWQLMVGLNYSPVSMPNTDWGIGYRYFNGDDADLELSGGVYAPASLEYTTHSLEANAKFHF